MSMLLARNTGGKRPNGGARKIGRSLALTAKKVAKRLGAFSPRPLRSAAGLLACLVLSAGLESSAAEARMAVRIGYSELPGFTEQTADGRRSGYGYEFLQNIASRAGWNLEYVGYDRDWTEMEGMLEKGEIDLLPGIIKNRNERKNRFFREPMGFCVVDIIGGRPDSCFLPQDYTTWSGMRVGMPNQKRIHELFSEWAASVTFSIRCFHSIPISIYRSAGIQAGWTRLSPSVSAFRQ